MKNQLKYEERNLTAPELAVECSQGLLPLCLNHWSLCRPENSDIDIYISYRSLLIKIVLFSLFLLLLFIFIYF